MVTFFNLLTLSILGISTLTTHVNAAPQLPVSETETSPTTQRFSFARTVDDKSAHPDTAPSPKEAWQAYRDSADKDRDVPAATGSAGSERRSDLSPLVCTKNDKGPVSPPSPLSCPKFQWVILTLENPWREL